ncbi:MAG: SDR family NAD(P)-dependent oxidoreductase [Burkholderiaceae bacterium]|jgi:NAD(P)-dependent dehydrogenase (short-subunit alcohol dehydrogenase family)
MSLTNLQARRVLVTGAASGIGLETALAFARQGAVLIITDINVEALSRAQQAVRQTGAACHAYVADVSDAADMEALARRVSDEHGVLDVLVNNAGIAFLGSFECTPLSQWQRTLGINVLGVVHGCHYFLPSMREAGGARHIVNIASAAGLAPTFNMSAYAASKHAIIGFTECLSLELEGSNVSVSVVCPGVINTPIAQPSASSVGSNIRPDQLAKLGRFYAEKGAHPSVVAASVVEAVRSGRGMVLVGPYAALIYHLRRISRRLLRKILIADSRKMGWI